MAETGDALARAYARLTALRNNVNELSLVEEKFAREYHLILDGLQSIGVDVSEFRIPSSEIAPRVTAVYQGGGRSYSEEKYVDKAFMLAKVDAILGYFEITMSQKPRQIGFRLPNK